VRVTNTAALLDALRAVPGVSAADIEADERPEGAGTLRLQLEPGADEVAVATSVNRVLREQFGLAVDANRVQVVEESTPTRPSGPDPLTAPLDDVLDSAPPRPTLTAVPGYLGQADAEDVAADAEWHGEGGAAQLGATGFDEGLAPFAPTATPPVSPFGPSGLGAPKTPSGVPATDEPAPPAQAPLEQAGATSTELVDSIETAVDALPGRSPRILIARMQLVSAGLGVTTEVTLSWQGEPFAGQSAAAATPTSVHRSVAQATLRAVESVVGGRARFELEQLEINQLGPDRAVVVVVSMLTKAGSERLTGVSVVREDVRQAVIRATLDALNRRLESLLLIA
jgi:hypothetical protein